MARTVAIGIQDFGDLIRKNCFYIDKTHFIKEWWENEDVVTLIARPRRFGKTLTMSMLEYFFSVKYSGHGKLFEGLSVWEEEKYREMQGTYPVINLSFANVKETTYRKTVERMNQILTELYNKNLFLLDSGILTGEEERFFRSVTMDMPETTATMAVHFLSDYLSRYYGRKVIILLDEYDTPMQEAYLNGFWDELVAFVRGMFNSAFKTNPFLERAIMTGITRVSKESIFSDLNNLEAITTTSVKYSDVFGFTEREVFTSLDEFGILDHSSVKMWYDGFAFGKKQDIYNPWSIINYLDKGVLTTYWANTSANSLVGKLIREGSRDIKLDFESLLYGKSIYSEIDEQIVYNQLDDSEEAIWSLLLASGYLRVVGIEDEMYELVLTNYEVRRMFRKMFRGWFKKGGSYNEFVKALLMGDEEAMNAYMNRISLSTFSSFDTGKQASVSEPERFYHGFVLGLMAELEGRYVILSNRESGFGRYDVMMEPIKKEDPAIIIEFKVYNDSREETLEETVQAALAQIEEKRYEQTLLDHNISIERISKYGFAFKGKEVLIGH